MPRIILFIFTLILITGCYDEKPSINKHGLSTVPLSQYTYRGIVERTIDLKFKVEKSKLSKVIAKVEMQYDYNAPLNFEWKLDSGVQLHRGQLKGQIPYLKKNNPIEFEIEVSGFTEDVAHFIRFEILGTNPNKRVFVDGILNSENKSFEKIVQEIEAYKKGQQP